MLHHEEELHALMWINEMPPLIILGTNLFVQMKPYFIRESNEGQLHYYELTAKTSHRN
jgi:hypothetical protein